MMTKCWEVDPQNRPSFKELHSNISKYIERIAGYLELGFNPFLTRDGASMGNGGVEGGKGEFQFNVIPP